MVDLKVCKSSTFQIRKFGNENENRNSRTSIISHDSDEND